MEFLDLKPDKMKEVTAQNGINEDEPKPAVVDTFIPNAIKIKHRPAPIKLS